MQLEELINKNYKQLNENDLYIWKYIASHKKECERLSIDELAKRCNVSRTTILRFSKRIGLKGYAEFKVVLRMNNENYQKAQHGLETLYESYNEYMETIKNKDFSKVLSLIHNAKNLYVYGTGMIQNNVASELKRSFSQVDRLFFTIKSRDETYAFVDIMNPEDVIIIISYAGENVAMLDFVKKIKMKNIPIISITAIKDNTLSCMADESMYVVSPSIVNPLGPRYEGLVAYFILLDFIIAKYIDTYSNKEVSC